MRLLVGGAAALVLLSGCVSDGEVADQKYTKEDTIILQAVDQTVISGYMSPAGAARLYAYTLGAASEAKETGGPGAASVAALTVLEGMLPLGDRVRSTALPGLAGRARASSPTAAEIGEAVGEDWLRKSGQDGVSELTGAFGTDNDLKSETFQVDIPALRERIGIGAEGLNRTESAQAQIDRLGAAETLLSDHELFAWQPTPTGYASPETPDWGAVAPLNLNTADLDVCRLERPDNSQLLTEGFELLYTYDLVDSANWQVTVWLGGRGTVTPPGMWIQMAATAAEEAGEDVLSVAAATAISIHNAIILGWDEKFRHNIARPENLWERLFEQPESTIRDTPAHPAYPSGHSLISAAAAAVIENRLGNDTPLTLEVPGTLGFGDVTVPFANAEEALESVSRSRVMARFHYPVDTTGGHRLGRCVAQLTLDALP